MSYIADSFRSRAAHTLKTCASALAIDLDPFALDKLVDYACLIDKWNRLTSLVRVDGLDAIVDDHLVDCLPLIPYLRGPRIADIGSGAGLPGVVVAIVCPNDSVYLVESNQRRARFLAQARIELGLRNVEVVSCRVEQWRPDDRPTSITSRAYSRLDRFYTDCAHLITAGCRLVAMKGQIVDDELSALAAVCCDSASINVVTFDRPGRRHRNAVVIDFPDTGESH